MRAPSAALIHLDQQIERLIEELPGLHTARGCEVNDAVVAHDSHERVGAPRLASLVRLGPRPRCRSVPPGGRAVVVRECNGCRRGPAHRCSRIRLRDGGNAECLVDAQPLNLARPGLVQFGAGLRGADSTTPLVSGVVLEPKPGAIDEDGLHPLHRAALGRQLDEDPLVGVRPRREEPLTVR